MGRSGLPGAAGLTRRILAILAALVAFCACAAQQSSSQPRLVPSSGPVKVSAEWLRTLPGDTIDGFTFHLFNADGLPAQSWQGLEVSGGIGETGFDFTVSSTGPAKNDIYLYVTYDGGSYSLDATDPDESRLNDYLFLSIPHRIKDVVAIGMARTGTHRGASAAAGPLLHLSFSPGHERVYRSVSLVNEDPRSAVELSWGGGGCLEVELCWDERNIGDYNNNGLVEVGDLTPLGVYYETAVATAADKNAVRLVDGNLDGYITVADLTPIGSNYQRSIEGYSVYYSNSPDGDPATFNAVGIPAVTRQSVLNNTPPEWLKHRLHYTYYANEAVYEHNYYYVRAVSVDGPVIHEGPPSNTVYVHFSPNQPPYWESTEGITSARSTADGIALEFGRAIDPDPWLEDYVDYVLRYVTFDLEIGYAGTVEVIIPPGATFGDPPYSWELTGLERGQTYKLRLTARDTSGAETDNTFDTVAKYPAIGVSTDTWAYHRRDPARTGCNPGSGLTEPLEEAWSVDLSGDSEFTRISQPVITGEGYVLTLDGDGTVHRINLADNSDATEHSSIAADYPGYLATSSPRALATLPGGVTYFDFASAETLGIYEGNTPVTAPLLLGDYIYYAGQGGLLEVIVPGDPAFDLEYRVISTDAYSIHLIADADYLYAVNDAGRIDKFDRVTGDSVATANLAAMPAAGTIALDEVNGRVYFSTVDDWLLELDSSDLSVLRTWDDPLGPDPSRSAPALALFHDPPLALVAGVQGGLYAAELDAGGAAWQVAIDDQPAAEPYRTAVTCNSQRIFVTSSQFMPQIFDLDGNLRQQINAPGLPQSDLIIGDDHAVYVADGRLHAFSTAVDQAPQWVGTTGVRRLVPGDGRVHVHWDRAVDDHGEPVHYVIYYRESNLPELSSPYADTVLITGIPHTGDTHARWVEGLENGKRYYFAVRAYDGHWDESPNTDQNTEVLAVTPPWQREELRLGDVLPAGGVYTMRSLGVGDTGVHLVYNDDSDGHLVHAWADFTAGSPVGATWQHEGSGLASYIAGAFEPAWNPASDDLAIAWATLSEVGHLARTGPDTWNNQLFLEVTPGINPQVSLDYGTEAVYAYNEDVELGPVENHVDYYLKRTTGLVWNLYEPLEETNLSGRDIDLVMNPADGLSPWAALQRGGESTPGRHTPQEGECMYAWWDSGGAAWVYDTVDSGANAPQSDCGKRVQQALDGAGNPHLVYLDLNASPDEPLGQLKYAFHDGSSWTVETVSSFSLSFQTSNLQFTYGELGIALIDDDAGGVQPVIAVLDRKSGSTSGQPHLAVMEVWFREGAATWRMEQLTDEEWAFPRDREPCCLVVTADPGSGLEYINVFYATTSDPESHSSADQVVHFWREWNP